MQWALNCRIAMSWKTIPFSDAFRPLKVTPFTRDELNYSGGHYQNVHYGDILVRFPSVVDADNAGLPFVNASSEERCGRCSILQNGDIIIADTAEDEAVGKAIEIRGIKKQKIVSGLHTMAFRPQEGIFAPGFLGYFLNSPEYHNQLLPLMQGTKVTSISKTAIRDTIIKYPSSEEQESIVAAFTEVDQLINAIDEAVAKKRQIKEGVMRQLLTGSTRIPGYNEEWVELELGTILSYEQPGPYLVQSTEYVESGTPVLTAGKTFILGYTNEKNGIYDKLPVIIFDDFVTESKYVDFPFKAKSSAMKMLSVRDKGRHNVRFIYDVMQLIDFPMTDHKRYWIAEYSHLKVRVPNSLEEENAIANAFANIDDEIHQLEAQRDKYTLIKQGMMQELLTGKTRLI